MPNWTLLGVLVAVAVAVAALGTAASLRYGVAGRRVAACLAFLCFMSLAVPTLRAPHVNGLQAQAITCLRALNAAQLLHSTSLGNGLYAKTLEELERGAEWKSSACPPIQMVSSGDRYAASAVPPRYPRLKEGPARVFCVGESGSIFWAPGDIAPAIDSGRCPAGWKLIQ